MNKTPFQITFGFGCFWAWVYLSFNSVRLPVLTQSGLPALSLLHIVSGICGCIVFMIIGLLYRFVRPLFSSRWFLVCAAVGTALGSAGYAVTIWNSSEVLVFVGAIVSGVLSPLIVLYWGLIFCRLDARDATVFSAASFFFSGVLSILYFVLPPLLGGILVSLFPCISAVCAWMIPMSAKDLYSETTNAMESFKEFYRFTSSGTGRVLFGVTVVMLVSGGLRSELMSSAAWVFDSPALLVAPISIVSLAFYFYGRTLSRTSINLGPLYRMVTPILALAIVVLVMYSDTHVDFSYGAVNAGCTLIDMLTWVLVIEIVRSTHYLALLVLAAGRFAIHFGMALGEMSAFLAWIDPKVLFVCALLLIGFTFTDKETSFMFEPLKVSELKHNQGDIFDGLRERVHAVCASHHLTPRETEVFELWALGYGSKAIEEKLCVSAATVKTHIRHIYEKCDAHSRADLINLLNESGSDTQA